ncbi:hypothetical protein FGO68_gene8303 [Halteria grandinella]|uniref:Uncharacterized protein n=1 Tax=Halteria grandinella TaxID=5974 RepID=A0A8J8NAW3_HALGN|nr:hypothetical protein FGO68_gene8303 [Halteria grandinella]
MKIINDLSRVPLIRPLQGKSKQRIPLATELRILFERITMELNLNIEYTYISLGNTSRRCGQIQPQITQESILLANQGPRTDKQFVNWRF